MQEHLSLDIADHESNTALIYASAFGYADIVNLFLEDFRLLRHLLNVNAENDHGKTAFNLALDNGHITVARMLCLEIQRYQVFLDSFTDKEKVVIGLTEVSSYIDYSCLYEMSKNKPIANAAVSPYESGKFTFLTEKAPTYAEVAATTLGQSEEKKSRKEKKKRKKSQRKGKLERENTSDSTTSLTSTSANDGGNVSMEAVGLKRATQDAGLYKDERVVEDGGEVFLKTDGVVSVENEIEAIETKMQETHGISSENCSRGDEHDGEADDTDRPTTRRDEMTPSTAYLQVAYQQIDAASNTVDLETDQLMLSARKLSFKWSPAVLPKIGAMTNPNQAETSDFKLPPIKDAVTCRDSPVHKSIKRQTLDADLINSGREFLSPALLSKNREKRRSSLTMDTTNAFLPPSSHSG
jgi:flagellar basal body rod protein FlgB